MNSTFTTIPEFPLYEIDYNANIRNTYSGKIMSQRHDNQGMRRVNLYNGVKHATILVHRLMAMTFLKGWNRGLLVEHLDRNVANNELTNLYLVKRHNGDRFRDRWNWSVWNRHASLTNPWDLVDSWTSP